MEKTTHISEKTSMQWRAIDSVYYDCHVTSLAQILPDNLYYNWLTVCALPKLEYQWNGLSCRNLLDSEANRDFVLFNQFGVEKTQVPIVGDLNDRIESTVLKQGYCIARVDSYYHEHFDEFYLKEHRVNGHKVTVVDWDDEYFYGIDNLGIKTLVLPFKKDWFIESIRSNLFHVYEKEDTFYYLEKSSIEEATRNISKQEILVDESISAWMQHRFEHQDDFNMYEQIFAADLLQSNPRPYAQVHNSYTSALMIETAYTALNESWSSNPAYLTNHVADSEKLVESIGETTKAWRMFKMLCKAKDANGGFSDAALLNILKQVIQSEKSLNDVLLGSNFIKKERRI